MQKFIKYTCVLSLLFFTLTTSASVLPHTHFGGTSPVEMAEAWTTQFSQDNCRETLKAIPFGVEVDENNGFIAKFTDGSLDYLNVGGNNSDPKIIIEDTTQLTKLVAPCRCLNRYADLRVSSNIFSSSLRSYSTEEDRAAAIREKKERMQKKIWFERFLLNQNSLCEHINFQIDSSQNPDTINYCFYTDLSPFDQGATVIKNLQSLTKLDFDDNNCQINTAAEKCNMHLSAAQAKCASNLNADISPNLLPDTGAAELPIERTCSNLRYFGCLSNSKPEYLDIEPGYTSESLDVNKVLKTEGQKGFQGIEDDQGAGANNPAINFILYIINTLSNLSFLIAVFFLIMGGFYMVVASGNSEATDKGKTAIKNFIFAITFTLLSYTIVVIIRTLLYS